MRSVMSFLKALQSEKSCTVTESKYTTMDNSPSDLIISTMGTDLIDELYHVCADFVDQWKEEAFELSTNLRVDDSTRNIKGDFLVDALFSLVAESLEVQDPQKTIEEQQQQEEDDGFSDID